MNQSCSFEVCGLILFSNSALHVIQDILRKYQVNSDYNDSKTRQSLYKEVLPSVDCPLPQLHFETIQKPHTRVYCSLCSFELTRNCLITTVNDYYCVPCFATLEQFPNQYMVRSSLRLSPSGTEWDLMDEVILTNAIKNWGYSNWGQIRQYMEYNQSPFPLEAIKRHYQQFFYNQPDNLIKFPTELPKAIPHTPYGQIALQKYLQTGSIQPNEQMLKRKQSKCEKKPSSNRTLPPQHQGGLKPLPSSMQDDPGQEGERKNGTEKRKQNAVLGYNPKRDEFQVYMFDPNAEEMLAELQFNESDSAEEQAIKISLIEQYNRRLSERTKRKQFTVEYKLLDSHYQLSLHPEEQKVSMIFQPFMRFTSRHQEYTQMVDTFSTINKQQSHVTSLVKIKNRSSSGSLSAAHQFLQRQRQKNIQKWEDNYNQTFTDKRKRKVYRKNCKEDGTIELIEDAAEGEVSTLSIPYLRESIQTAKVQGRFRGPQLEVTSLNVFLQPQSQNKIQAGMSIE